MKTLALLAALAAPVSAIADGFILGAGRWTCADALAVGETGKPIEIGQMVGWVLGYWSAETYYRGEDFTDKVEAAGGKQVFQAMLAECRKAPPETPVFRVVQAIISGTK